MGSEYLPSGHILMTPYMSCDMSLKFLIYHGDHMSCTYAMVTYVMMIRHGEFFLPMCLVLEKKTIPTGIG